MANRDGREPLLERTIAEYVDAVRALYNQTGSVPDCLISAFGSGMAVLIWSYSCPPTRGY